MRRFALPLALSTALLAGGCANTAAQPQSGLALAPEPTGRPQLVLAISIDQLSSDVFIANRARFTGGFARLQQGVVFPSGYQSHAATETCPGHSTILTGTRPARNGIIANNWFEPGIGRADKRVYCSEDTKDPASTSREPVVSAQFLKVPTLGEYMKDAAPGTRNVAVSAKDRAVVMMGGHKIDAGYWYKGGAFITFRGQALSPAAQVANAALARQIAAGAPALPVPAWCGVKDRAVTVGNGTVGTGKFALEPNKPDAFRVSPRMDSATVDLATALVDEMKLGQGAEPDVLSVSLSASDYVGHAYGTEGVEMCIQMAQLDAALGKLFAHLDARGIDYIAVLTADHGGLDTPERLDEQAFPRAARSDRALNPGELGMAVAARTGIKVEGPLVYGDGPFGDMYFSAALTPAQRAQASAALVAIVRPHPQVAAVFTRAELEQTPLPSTGPQDWSIKDRVRASFDPARSGDVIVVLDRAVVPIPDPVLGAYTATHGSVWDYDRRVPMLFWRKGLRGFEQPAPVETVDIAPTLAAVLGLKLPDGTFDGRCLDLDAGAGNSCGKD